MLKLTIVVTSPHITQVTGAYNYTLLRQIKYLWH